VARVGQEAADAEAQKPRLQHVVAHLVEEERAALGANDFSIRRSDPSAWLCSRLL